MCDNLGLFNEFTQKNQKRLENVVSICHNIIASLRVEGTMTAAVILAAGDGKRMKSQNPKVCCEVLFKPMLSWVTDSCKDFGISDENTCVVVSDNPKGVLDLITPSMKTAVQSERKGTGHAVLCAMDFLLQAQKNKIEDIVVLCGDAPFADKMALNESYQYHRSQKNDVTVLTARLENPSRYGRIIRNSRQEFIKILEAADANDQELLINEINSGTYWFSVSYLISHLPLLKAQNAQGEYYLTDMVELALSTGHRAGAFVCSNPDIALGANDRAGLALLNRTARDFILNRHYQNGVNIPIADGVVIGPDVKIGADTTILPGTLLYGRVTIGNGCTIGPNTRIINCAVGDNCIIDSSRLEQSTVGSSVRLGPFAQLRPNCKIADNVKIGNFVEVKNSTVGEKTSFAHLTYIGDSDFGARINVGCGVVTVNYDGRSKHRTTVGDDAFIGCNSNLIAPVTVENGAYVAAATTVTQTVPQNAMAIGRVRQTLYPNYALRYRKKK